MEMAKDKVIYDLLYRSLQVFNAEIDVLEVTPEVLETAAKLQTLMKSEDDGYD